MARPSSPCRRAVIAGASLSGLLAARALSRSYDQVVIVDQDVLPEEPVPRRGVGQAHHSHVLLQGGIRALESLFPGISFTLKQAGPGTADAAADFRWYQSGAWKPRFRSGVRMLWCERYRLEWHVRKQLVRENDVEFLEQRRVVGYLTDSAGSQVRGLRVERKEDGSQEELAADLVVDATGRGTRTPKLLAQMGLGEVPRDTCEVRLGYTSCKIERPANYDGSWKTLAIFPNPPHSTKMGVIYPLDEERFHVTLGGWCGDHAPADLEGFRDFAASLDRPELYEYIRDAEPITKLRVFKVPRAVWRRYDKMERWPGGLLVLGDAIANFNPVYGQGMTVCALEARMLRDRLERLEDPAAQAARASFAQDFQSAAARIIALPWAMATSQDIRFPSIGDQSPLYSAIDWYTSHLLELSARDPRIHEKFLRVLTLEANPAILASPGTLAAVAGKALAG